MRLAIAIALTIAVVIGAQTASAGDGIFVPAGAHIVDPGTGVEGAPPGSMAANPTTDVVVVENGTEAALSSAGCTSNCVSDPDETGYAMTSWERQPLPTDQCKVKSSHVMLDYAPRRAHTYGRNYCEPPTTSTELFEWVERYSERYGYWRGKSQRAEKLGPFTLTVHVRLKCDNDNWKYWKGTALATSVINGVTYVGTNRKYNYQNCGTFD